MCLKSIQKLIKAMNYSKLTEFHSIVPMHHLIACPKSGLYTLLMSFSRNMPFLLFNTSKLNKSSSLMLFICRGNSFPPTDIHCLLYMAYIYNYFKALRFSLDIATITSFLYTSLSLCYDTLINTEQSVDVLTQAFCFISCGLHIFIKYDQIKFYLTGLFNRL